MAFPVFMIVEERSGGLGGEERNKEKGGKSKESDGYFSFLLLFCSPKANSDPGGGRDCGGVSRTRAFGSNERLQEEACGTGRATITALLHKWKELL